MQAYINDFMLEISYIQRAILAVNFCLYKKLKIFFYFSQFYIPTFCLSFFNTLFL